MGLGEDGIDRFAKGVVALRVATECTKVGRVRWWTGDTIGEAVKEREAILKRFEWGNGSWEGVALEGEIFQGAGLLGAGDPFRLNLIGIDAISLEKKDEAHRFFSGFSGADIGSHATGDGRETAGGDSGGSYKALITSLLTSDSFLYRKP